MRQERVTATVTTLVIASIVAVLLFFAPRTIHEEDGPGVAATIFPLFDIVENIAGDEVRTTLILPPGASPHTFEPSPSTLRQIRNAGVVYAIGHGADSWIQDLITREGVLETVDRGIALRKPSDSDHEDDEHDLADPHYWLDLRNAEQIATNVATDLTMRFPESGEIFRDNARDYIESLRQAEVRIRSLLGQIEHKKIVTFHDAWYYFAEAYGLEIAGTFEPTAGRQPTPRYLSALQETVEKAGVRTIYAEPQFSTAALEPFLIDNGLTIGILDPIGGVPGRETYIDLMLYNAQTIKENQR